MLDISQILLAATEAVQHAAPAMEQAVEAAAEVAHEDAQTGILGTLGVDWKLFVAQLINFGIVLFVFWKWIVKPLGTTLTERQNKIESGLKNAAYMEEEKKKFEDWKSKEMKKVQIEADQILKTTADTANKIKADTLADAQAQAGKVMEQAKASMENEKAEMMREVKQDVATLIVAASEKILRSKLDEKKDHELINESVKSIK